MYFLINSISGGHAPSTKFLNFLAHLNNLALMFTLMRSGEKNQHSSSEPTTRQPSVDSAFADWSLTFFI